MLTAPAREFVTDFESALYHQAAGRRLLRRGQGAQRPLSGAISES